MKMRFALLAILLCLVTACSADSERTSSRPATPLMVSTAERGLLRAIDSETLSQTARITGLVPDSGGNGVAFTFTDPERDIVSGLGIIDRQHDHAQLVWPDSVIAVWWSAPHHLAFTSSTGFGVSVLIDVGAATLEVAEDTSVVFTRPISSSRLVMRNARARTRAGEYIDSVRLQLRGGATREALRYQVERLLVAPTDSVAAFYVVATDTAGIQFNPSWYVLDIQSGQVKPVDSLIAIARDMPMDAAAWDGGQRFLYTKGKALYEVRVGR